MYLDFKKKFREAVLSALPDTLEAAWKAFRENDKRGDKF